MDKIKVFWYLLNTILIGLLLDSCGQSYGKLESGDLVATGDAVDVSFSTSKILCTANIDVLLGKEYRLGVIYQSVSDMDEVAKMNSKFNYDDSQHQSVEDLIGNKYEVKLVDLNPSTEYQYRAYVKVGDKYYYGKIETFTTKDVKRYITVSTGDAVDVKSLSASVSYSLDIDDAEIRMLSYESGVIYSNSVKDDDELVIGDKSDIKYCRGEEDVVAKLSSLNGNSEYRYRAICGFGRDVVIYGKVKKFKTANPKDYVSISTGNASCKSSEAIVDFSLNINEEDIKNSCYSVGIIYSKSETAPDKLRLNESGVEKATSGNGYDCTISEFTPLTTYYYRAFFECGETVLYGDVKSFKTPKEGYAKKAVELGLSVKWAACNIGANRPEEYGYYFAWGETSPKSHFSEAGSKMSGLSWNELKQKGVINSQGRLTSSYDAATVNWGNEWRMPTMEEIDEFYAMVTVETVTKNGVKGLECYGPNGNSIFIPFSGKYDTDSRKYVGRYFYCWASTPIGNVYFANNLSNEEGGGYGFEADYRSHGLTIRPVHK